MFGNLNYTYTWYQMIKIGNVKIDTNVFLAPLSGCADLAFRLIAREHGAKFCFFEMVDAISLERNTKKTLYLLKTNTKDKPIAAQILGSDPDSIFRAATRLLDIADISFLDINCACPVKKVIKKKAGAYLLNDPERLYRILDKLSASLKIPITAKIRIGYERAEAEEIKRIAKGCEDNGAAALFVHGRTRAQGYSGEVNYECIKAICECLKIPVFGTGNIFNPELAKKMIDETGCAGILVARGAMGNPWIFKNIELYLKYGKITAGPDITERKETLKRHLSYIDMEKYISVSGKAGFMRKVALWYIKGLPHATRIREKISRAKSHADIVELLDELL